MVALLNQYGTPFRQNEISRSSARELVSLGRSASRIRAKFDSAQTNSENEKHWSLTDSLSAVASASYAVRKRIRERARYETANNCYGVGLLLKLANYLVGTGPRLQLTSPNPEVNNFVEREFGWWMEEIDAAEKLRTCVIAKSRDGEAFGFSKTNNRLPTPVTTDLRVFECDHVHSARFYAETERYVDGITVDGDGNPIKYDVLRQHPGSTCLEGFGEEFDEIPAASMIHLFRVDRAGQQRGVSELAAALHYFGQLRRYVLAVLAAAETAADFAAVMYTDSNALSAEDIPNITDDVMQIERRMFNILPNGWKMGQLKAEQPTTSFGEFRDKIVSELAQCLGIPKNIVLGDSSDYNYASGRLDHQSFFLSINVQRRYLERRALNRMFGWWLEEAELIDGYLPREAFPFQRSWVSWQWDGFEHVDPQKEANAQKTRLGSGTTNRYLEAQRSGIDLDQHDAQAARSYGVSVEEYRRMLFENTFYPASGVQGGFEDGDE